MNFDKLTQYLDSLFDTYKIPATDCKITKNHEIVYRHMTGYTDLENKKPINKDTIFRLYSATKLVTMVAIMQQIEKSNLSLYDEVSKFLPEFNKILVSDNFNFEFPITWPKSTDRCHIAHNTIRIIDLMSMTSGLTYDTQSKELKDIKARSNNKASTREVVSEIAKMPLAYEPRTRYMYSLSHDVLGAVIEVVSGKKYSQYLKENIFEPLGIKDFYFHWEDDNDISSKICSMYTGVFGTDDIVPDDGILSESFKITKNYESGGAGLASTVDAYSLFIDALCNGGVGANGARILSEESIKMFTIPYTTGKMSKDFSLSGKQGYEYGLGVRVLVDDKVSKSPIGEFGWDGAAGAYALVDPINNVSIFYCQHTMMFLKVYQEIHPTIRDLAYEALNN